MRQTPERIDDTAPQSSWPTQLRWLLTLLTCVAVAFAWGHEARESDTETLRVSEKLRIDRMHPLEVSPGGTLAIAYSGSEPTAGPVNVTIDKRPVETLRVTPQTIVVRLPQDLAEGRMKVRIHQGDERSKKLDVWVHPLEASSVILLGLGGIALFVLGLRTLARGIRTYTGHRMRNALERLTRGVWRSAALGVVTGSATQSTVASAGVLVGLLSSNLLPIMMALAIVLGAQLGASVMALVLPWGARFSVLLVTLGVIWVALADNRHSRALAKVLLGLGLLFLGFENLRSGFQPLVSEPGVLGWVGAPGSGIGSLLLSASAGALATALLQGPGPAFVLVLGLAESSDLVGTRQGLTLLAGVPLGAALATTVVAWPFGGAPRRLAVGHLIVGGVSTILLLASVDLWVMLADYLVPGDPNAVGYDEHVHFPALATHLVTAFLLSQTVVIAMVVALLPRVRRWLEVPRRQGGRTSAPLNEGADDAPPLLAAIENLRDALAAVRQIWLTGDRAQVSTSEHALDLAQRHLVEVLEAHRRTTSERSSSMFALTLALLEVHDSLSSMQRQAERGVEWGVTPKDREIDALGRQHKLVVQALDALTRAVPNPETNDLDSAREREIWLNAEDSRTRQTLELGRAELGMPYVRHWCAMSSAYEGLGNQLFRANDSLLGHDDE